MKTTQDSRMSDVFVVGVTVRGKCFDPASLTARLGIEPTRQFSRGEEYASKSGQVLKHPWGLWALDVSDNGVDLDPTKAVQNLLSQLLPHAGVFLELRTDPDLRVAASLFWQPDQGSGGYTLTAEEMGALLGLVGEVDYYFC